MTDAHQRPSIDPGVLDEPDGSGELFPRLVRVPVFRWMWAVLVVLLIALAVLAVQYCQLTGT